MDNNWNKYIYNSGNVGIGETNPKQKLDVNCIIYINNDNNLSYNASHEYRHRLSTFHDSGAVDNIFITSMFGDMDKQQGQ